MPVLRSQQKPSSSKTLQNGIIEPSTPLKLTQPNIKPNRTAKLSSGSPGLFRRRRSLRLASMSNASDDLPVFTRKRTRINSGKNQFNCARVSDSEDEVFNVDGSVRVSDSDVEVEVSKRVKGMGDISGENGCLTLRSGSKFEKRLSGVLVDERVIDDNQFLSLRSGSKLSKRTLEVSNGEETRMKEDKGKGVLIEERRVDEDGENGGLSLRSGTKLSKRTLEVGDNDKGKGKGVLIEEEVVDDLSLSLGNSESKGLKRFTRHEKGKGKLVISDNGTLDNDEVVNLELGLNLSSIKKALFNVMEQVRMDTLGSDSTTISENEVENEVWKEENTNSKEGGTRNLMNHFKDIAKRNAHKYAYFNAREEEQESNVNIEGEPEEVPLEEPVADVEDWPGPFSTAMKIIRDREKNMNAQVQNLSTAKGVTPLVSWTPRKERGPDWVKRTPTSLQDFCLSILAKNVDSITSLQYVPDVLRHKLSQSLCDSRTMNVHFLSLLLEGSPSEIRLPDCSWLEEGEFEKSFGGFDTNNLTVLQLDLCGHCLSDSSLRTSLLPKGLSSMTTISLRGACRVSDAGLTSLVSSAHSLRSVNLSQCSLLTDVGINNLANSLGSVLRELYLDDCETLDALRILPALKRLQGLEVLSLRGIGSISDKFMKELIVSNGQNLKELILANCPQLTDSSMKVIAETCSQLFVLDLSHLSKLTDIGMAYIANGCREIQDLKLCRNTFSDDAIAAFLETSGASLKELSLNNITKVGQNTTISLARRCKSLHSLDLSWCRRLTDEALGFIADSCLSLRVLKIFGCTQISRTFVDGQSNPDLHIIGLKLTPILENIKRPDFQQGPLHYSGVPSL